MQNPTEKANSALIKRVVLDVNPGRFSGSR